MIDIEPLSEIEEFRIPGFPVLEAFHTSGGTSTMPETFGSNVGECFEKTIRYQGHVAKIEIAPRALMADLMIEKLKGDQPDVTIMRIEAHRGKLVHAFTMVDKYD